MPYGHNFSHVTAAIRKSVKPESLSDTLMSYSFGYEDAVQVCTKIKDKMILSVNVK